MMVKGVPSGCRERHRQKPWHQGDVEVPLKGCWALEASSCAWGWAFWRDTWLAQPSQGPATSQPVEVSQVVTHVLDEFCLLIWKWLSRKSHRWWFVWAEPRRHAYPEGPGSGSSSGPRSFHGIHGFASLILGGLLHVLEKGMAAALVLHLPRDAWPTWGRSA